MKNLSILSVLCFVALALSICAKPKKTTPDLWPDGQEIGQWFKETTPVDVSKLGKQYRLTDHGIFADGTMHTEQIQALIDKAANNGGGVIVVPSGVYMTGGLHFKQGYNLYYYSSDKPALEMDFFIRDAESLIPIEVKASDGATASLNNLLKEEKYPDINYGIKLGYKNIGFNGKFYTFPYFLTFLLKRFVTKRG